MPGCWRILFLACADSPSSPPPPPQANNNHLSYYANESQYQDGADPKRSVCLAGVRARTVVRLCAVELAVVLCCTGC